LPKWEYKLRAPPAVHHEPEFTVYCIKAAADRAIVCGVLEKGGTLPILRILKALVRSITKHTFVIDTTLEDYKQWNIWD
jgi:hypothetical protein